MGVADFARQINRRARRLVRPGAESSGQSDRRKLSRFCCCVSESVLKLSITALASEASRLRAIPLWCPFTDACHNASAVIEQHCFFVRIVIKECASRDVCSFGNVGGCGFIKAAFFKELNRHGVNAIFTP